MTPSRTFRHTTIARTVFGASGALLGLGLGLLVAVNGCEEQASTPPPVATPPANPGGGLSQNPKSLLGRSAKTAKDTAAQVENRSAEAAAMANEMAGQSGKFAIAGLEWSVPTSWKQAELKSNFIAADFRIPGDGGEARFTVSTFAGDGKTGPGGTIDMNVQRWEAQFKDPLTGSSVLAHPVLRKVAGFQLTIVKLDGIMKGGTPGGPKEDTPDTALRGVFIEGPQGLVVLKLTGPKETVDAVNPEWDIMVNSMTKKTE
jgi:hypothetical protein